MAVGYRLNPWFYESTGLPACIRALNSRGLEVVESGMAPGMPEWEVRDEIVDHCQREGLNWQFHSRVDTGLFRRGPEWDERAPVYTTALQWLAGVAKKLGTTVNLTVHGPQSHKLALPWLGLDDMTAVTCACLEWLHEHIQRIGCDVRICLENLPHKPSVERVGDSAAGLLAIHRRMGVEWLYFCWDIGHEGEEANYRPVPVLPEFVAHVRTVHVHDAKQVDGLAVAHQLPGPGLVPFRERFRALKQLPDDVPLVLEIGRGLSEVPPERCLDAVADAIAAVEREWREA